jgi:hypothetical protein
MNTPTHAQISERAFTIWQNANCTGDPTAIWLDAERQMTTESVSAKPRFTAHALESSPGESRGEHAASQQSMQQKNAARAPQLPTHIGPKSAPAKSGKPLWDRPHSS